MLKLTRIAGESILLGQLGTLKIVEAKETCARVEVVAPQMKIFYKAVRSLGQLTTDVIYGESFMVGDHISVAFLQVKGSGPKRRVKLGIDAPRYIEILRAELVRGKTPAAQMVV